MDNIDRPLADLLDHIVGQMLCPPCKHVQAPIPGTCAYVTLRDKRDLGNVIKAKNREKAEIVLDFP